MDEQYFFETNKDDGLAMTTIFRIIHHGVTLVYLHHVLILDVVVTPFVSS
jgi:hypothetical protein